MTALNAPYAHGTKVTVGRKEDCCHVCGKADFYFDKALSADEGLFFCGWCSQPPDFRFRYDAVTPVDPATGHAQGHPKEAEDGQYDIGPAKLDEQTPPPCLEGCVAEHEKYRSEREGRSKHCTILLAHPRLGISRPWYQRRLPGDPDDPYIFVAAGPGDGTVELNSGQARVLAAVIEEDNPGSPLAAALREAAEMLDQIGGA